jgi:serine/threonine protein kinase
MPLTARTILGHYEIGSPLGADEMGEVYRAHDTPLDRKLAIRAMPESLIL